MERLYRIKDKLISCVEREMSKGVENVNTHEMGMVIDMIKDLSEVEKACAEADYYESVVDAMDEGAGRYGYDGLDRSNSRMMRDGGDNDRMGYRNQYGNWPANPKNRRRMRRRGYSEESIENIRQMMEEADPARREQLKRDLQDLVQEM